MKKTFKNVLFVIAILGLFFTVTGCSNKTVKADYTTDQAETKLNKGADIKGKTISIKVDKLDPNSAFGYNIESGKHLNFVSNDNPHVKKGQKIIVKVKKTTSTLGSYVITYDKVE
ncbi:hypothetical protein ACRYI5_00485 [Furfurilactobacillus sp. WILCCON 0119]